MFFDDYRIVIERGNEVCFIRFNCSNASVMELINHFDRDGLMSRFFDNSSEDYSCEFYVNKGDNCILDLCYEEHNNRVTHGETITKHIVPSSINSFRACKPEQRVVLFEIDYDPNEDLISDYGNLCDPISFMYISILHSVLCRKGIEHVFMVFGSGEEGFSALNLSDYFKLRDFLCLIDEDLNNRITIFDSKKGVWRRLFTDFSVGQVQGLGRISPLFNISNETLLFLQAGYNNLPQNRSIYKVLNHYWNDLIDLTSKYDVLINLSEYRESDTIIDLLLFSCTVCYIIKELEENQEFENTEIHNYLKRYDFAVLHERCVDYAQGVMQLIENAYFHAICNSDSSLGFWCIRIRKKSNTISVKDRFNNNEGKALTATYDKNLSDSYYMEVYVADYSMGGSAEYGIVNKFYDNIQDRWNNLSGDTDTDELECLAEVLDSRNSDTPIRLKHLFGVDWEASALKRYLQLPENVAWHYGLQILDNIVLTGDGCLYVRSGADSYYTDEQTDYNEMEIPWSNGTAYVIVLPLQLYGGKTTSYLDTIDRVDEGTYSGIDPFVEYEYQKLYDKVYINIDISSPNLKNNMVEQLVNAMCKDSAFIGNVYIDCINIVNNFDLEILAKALFLCFSRTKIVNLGLINLANPREVIKLFRLFALFYDRHGENIIMNDKSVFMADINANMDLLLYGPLSSIKHSLYSTQIRGGSSEEIMKIISYLGSRGDWKNV